MSGDIKVSVICDAYNQEDYIAQTLQSIVDQKTDFKYEILVHDDASTDKTSNIIYSFAEAYPELIKPMVQIENQYSQNVDINIVFQYARVSGQYIAFCEGDDYWTDPYKLQKQVDVLDKNPDVDICAHSANAVKADTCAVLYKIAPKDDYSLISVEEVINGGGGYVATNSLMIRSDIVLDIPSWHKVLPMDYSLQILGSLRGGMIFLPDNMSDYRIMAKNSWSLKMRGNPKKRLEINRKLFDMLSALNEATEHKYQDVISTKCEEISFWNLYYSESYKEMKKNPYRAMYKSLAFKEKALINLHLYAPWLLQIIRKVMY